MNIQCLKLITGEDLIGEVELRMEGTVMIKDPCAIVMIPAAQNQFTVGLAPYLPFAAKKEFSFDPDDVVLRFEPANELRNEYSRITGKGITLPPTPKIELVT